MPVVRNTVIPCRIELRVFGSRRARGLLKFLNDVSGGILYLVKALALLANVRVKYLSLVYCCFSKYVRSTIKLEKYRPVGLAHSISDLKRWTSSRVKSKILTLTVKASAYFWRSTIANSPRTDISCVSPPGTLTGKIC